MYAFLRASPGIYTGQEDDCRQFVEAVLWIARMGAQWRFLPPPMVAGIACLNGMPAGVRKASGRRCLTTVLMTRIWNTCCWTAGWCGPIPALLEQPQKTLDGAPGADKAWGRRRGGFSTKVHRAVDGLGNPLRLILTPG